MLTEPVTDSFVLFAELKLTSVGTSSSVNGTIEFLIGVVRRTIPVTMHLTVFLFYRNDSVRFNTASRTFTGRAVQTHCCSGRRSRQEMSPSVTGVLSRLARRICIYPRRATTLISTAAAACSISIRLRKHAQRCMRTEAALTSNCVSREGSTLQSAY